MTGGANQPGDRPDEVSDERAQPVPAGFPGQKVVLHRPQKHLGNLPENVEGLIGQQLAAGWVVQVQVSQRTLERILLALLPAMTLDHLRDGQVVVGDDDDGEAME